MVGSAVSTDSSSPGDAVPGIASPGSGPSAVSANLWIICSENASGSSGPNIVARLSTDGGANYTAARIVGPACTTKSGGVGPGGSGDSLVYVDYRGSGALIDVGYQDPTGALCSIQFDTSTGSFGSPVSSTQVITPGTLGNFLLKVNGAGNQQISWFVPSFPVFVMVNVAGTWGAPVEVDNAAFPNYFLDEAVVIGNGTTLFLFGRGSGGPFRLGNKLWAIFDGTSITSRGDTGFAATINTQNIQAPFYTASVNKGAFPIIRVVTVGTNTAAQIALIIVSNPATPTFSIAPICTVDVETLGVNYAQITGNSGGTAFVSVWFRQPLISRDFTVEFATCSTLDGIWSTSAVFYNENLNPPTPHPSFTGLGPVYANTLANGALGVIAGLIVTTPGLWPGTLYTWVPIPPTHPPPSTAILTLVKIVSGGTSGPSATTLSATGPVTISGAGGVGPVSVPAGIFVLAETVLPGYTAGPWVITGTGGVLAGGVNLTLAPGGSVVATITNTFNSGPPGGTLKVRCIPSAYTKGVPYSAAFVVTGGVPPYFFSISSGSLPPGLTLNALTGVVSGTPTGTGTLNFKVTVTDSA